MHTIITRSWIQNFRSAIIESAESLEFLQKISQIALWDVAIMDKVRQKGGKKARQFKVAELQRSKMHVVGYIRELHVWACHNRAKVFTNSILSQNFSEDFMQNSKSKQA